MGPVDDDPVAAVRWTRDRFDGDVLGYPDAFRLERPPGWTITGTAGERYQLRPPSDGPLRATRRRAVGGTATAAATSRTRSFSVLATTSALVVDTGAVDVGRELLAALRPPGAVALG